MNKFFILAVIMVLLAGIFHMVFIVFDYGFHNSESGAFNLLRENLNNSMDSDWRNKTYNNSLMLREAFGYGRVICIILCPACFVIGVFKRDVGVE